MEQVNQKVFSVTQILLGLLKRDQITFCARVILFLPRRKSVRATACVIGVWPARHPGRVGGCILHQNLLVQSLH